VTVTAVPSDLDLRCIDTIRTLSMEAAQAANSEHPGTPMTLAPVAYCLGQRFWGFDPADPIWADQYRFVLSDGHGSGLLYSLLHPTGVCWPSPTTPRFGDVIAADGGTSEAILAELARIGIDRAALGAQLQGEGAASFDTWRRSLLGGVAGRHARLL
jgi:hypothetical protein